MIAGDLDYYQESEKLTEMVTQLSESPFIQPNSVWNWHESFNQWLIKEGADTAWYLSVEVDDSRFSIITIICPA